MTDLVNIFNTEDWMSDPRRPCGNPTNHPDEWFPTDNMGSKSAQALCHGCPVFAKCLDYAMNTHDPRFGYVEGVWGGTTTEQRRQARKSAQCGTPNGYKIHQRRKEIACAPCKGAHASKAAADARTKRAAERGAA